MPKRRRKTETKETLPAPVEAGPGEPLAGELLPQPAESAGTGLVPADPLRRYLAEIRQYPLLTREEERALSIRVREHADKEAARRLATSNLRLVVRIAMD